MIEELFIKHNVQPNLLGWVKIAELLQAQGLTEDVVLLTRAMAVQPHTLPGGVSPIDAKRAFFPAMTHCLAAVHYAIMRGRCQRCIASPSGVGPCHAPVKLRLEGVLFPVEARRVQELWDSPPWQPKKTSP